MNINICMALNEGYVRPTTVAMYSICSNACQNVQFCFYLLHRDLTVQSREYIQSKLSVFKDRYTVQYIDVPEQYYDKLPCIDVFGKETWYRVLIPLLLPNVDKVLYLDGDIIVLGDLSELYGIDLSLRAYAAASEKKPIVWKCNPIVQGRQHFRFRFFDKIGMDILDDHTHYVNAGVMLINCDYWRQNNYLEQVLAFADTHKDDPDYRFPDQDAINWVAHRDKSSNVEYFSLKYNFGPGVLKYKGGKMDLVYQTELKMYGIYQEYCEGWQPVVFHFAGLKPWNGAKYIERKIYREYANKIGWRIPKHKINIKNRFGELIKFWLPSGILSKLTN